MPSTTNCTIGSMKTQITLLIHCILVIRESCVSFQNRVCRFRIVCVVSESCVSFQNRVCRFRIVCVVSESTGHARRTTLNDHTICVGNHVGAKPNMRCKCSVRVLDQVLVVSPGKGHRAHQIEMTQLESHHRSVTEDILGP
jgi:hypothetical protein